MMTLWLKGKEKQALDVPLNYLKHTNHNILVNTWTKFQGIENLLQATRSKFDICNIGKIPSRGAWQVYLAIQFRGVSGGMNVKWVIERMLRTTARRLVFDRILKWIIFFLNYITGQFLLLGNFFGFFYKPWEFLMKLDLFYKLQHLP